MPTSARYGSMPFQEQLEFFREKLRLPTAAWTDIWTSQHDRAFVVAGLARDDMLADFQASIAKAIEDGTTLETFRKDFDRIVEDSGWDYKGGRNWRTRVIYDTNLRTSYAAGRSEQMRDPALLARRPYKLYRHGGSDDPRPEHLALDGLVLPADHPFWDVWEPPNGWGCSCKVFLISAEDAERMGLTISDDPPGWTFDREEVTVGVRGPSPRTVEVPRGIDPGFEYRPGESLEGNP